MSHIFIIHSPVDQTGPTSFSLLTTAAINRVVQYLCDEIQSPLGTCPDVVQLGYMVVFLEKPPMDFHKAYNSLYSHKQCLSILLSHILTRMYLQASLMV